MAFMCMLIIICMFFTFVIQFPLHFKSICAVCCVCKLKNNFIDFMLVNFLRIIFCT